MKGKNIAIIAGGTGVAPPRSVIEFVSKNRDKYQQINLFLGFRSPEDVLFKEDIQRWMQEFNTVFSVDKCSDPNYNGKVCFVTEAFNENIDVSSENTVAIVCGPPIMMKVVSELTKQRVKTLVSLNPIMVDWNKAVASRIAPMPGMK